MKPERSWHEQWKRSESRQRKRERLQGRPWQERPSPIFIQLGGIVIAHKVAPAFAAGNAVI
ncbi:hypothetical protein JCM19039_3868 [Geomicrobium sp. JCM 19039]|nr:hypothetical protein JCM19039_3868 [Geomicrobium sp. JCM 19039]